MRTFILLALGYGLGACATSQDPADGGFISGVSALGSGTYEDRIDERETDIMIGLNTQTSLEAELMSLQSEYTALKLELVRLRSALATSGVQLGAATDKRINMSLAFKPAGATETDQIAALRKAIADAKNLSSQLEGLSS